MEKKYEKYMTGGNGFIIIGIAWLLFWLGPAFGLFEEDSRWGHNYAIPIMFITVGLAYNMNYISCQLTAAVASYLTIPTLLGFWSWSTATKVALMFLAVLILLFLAERNSAKELIEPNMRLKRWLKIHLMTFAYIGLVHMTLIFFFVRWYNSDAFLQYLPMEHHPDTSAFNIMLVGLVVLAIAERFVQKIGEIKVTKAAFYWSILMIIVPLVIIAI
ncbi:MAG: hypothetical protein JSV49_07680 [Thermoplasmata archaeon]|nr:MAG: hypothetical protein JSV49_07680 [Thermoplasmata archaeon]